MRLRHLATLAAALGTPALLCGSAGSARVVEVRVGSHPTFTRVVFELDAPAGYRIERRSVEGGEELVVKLAAASLPRQVKSRSEMVELVDLESSGGESVARVRLRGDSPRVKELILGGPPRIVIDVMRPEEVVAGAPPPRLAAEPEPSEAAAEPEAPEVAAEPEPSQAAAEPEPSEVAAAPDAPKAAPRPVEAPRLAMPPAPKPVEGPSEKIEDALEGERIVQPQAARPDLPEPDAKAALPAPGAPADVAPTPPIAKLPPAPSPVRREARPKRFFGLEFDASDPWLTLGLVATGLVLFLIVVALLLRRHSRPTSLDALAVSRELAEPADEGEAFGTVSEPGVSAAPSFPAAGPGLFDDEREKGESEMDVPAELPIERGARASMGPMAIGADSGQAGTLQAIERRMAQLESRLDEANEARERLERQVTAQSEELRVQRAAIARTQRALRGMTRVGEEQATEPALRDPAKPGAGRA